jgi:hypothetical protein
MTIFKFGNWIWKVSKSTKSRKIGQRKVGKYGRNLKSLEFCILLWKKFEKLLEKYFRK